MSVYHMRLVYKGTDKYYMSLDLPKKTYCRYLDSFMNGHTLKGVHLIIDSDKDIYYLDFNRAEIDYMWNDKENLSNVQWELLDDEVQDDKEN